jgi:hypothetical protein
MDLTFYIKVVRYGLCWQVLTPDTWKLLCRKVRTLEKKAWAGWRRALYLWRKITEPGDRVLFYGMDEYGQITCRKPDGYLTTRMKPEELEKP